jgi:hypothetical protein
VRFTSDANGDSADEFRDDYSETRLSEGTRLQRRLALPHASKEGKKVKDFGYDITEILSEGRIRLPPYSAFFGSMKP